MYFIFHEPIITESLKVFRHCPRSPAENPGRCDRETTAMLSAASRQTAALWLRFVKNRFGSVLQLLSAGQPHNLAGGGRIFLNVLCIGLSRAFFAYRAPSQGLPSGPLTTRVPKSNLDQLHFVTTFLNLSPASLGDIP